MTVVPFVLAQHAGADLTPTTDVVSQAIVGTTIVALFTLLTVEAAHRVLIVMGAAAFLWLVTYLTPYHVIPFASAWEAIDVNVILLLAGMMALIGVLKDTGVFAWGVARLMHATGGRPRVVLALLIWITAALSAMLDNVTTVVFITPVAIAMARQLNLAPAALLMPMVLASNVGGTATLVGDPPNIMIGSGAGIPFVAFLLNVAGPVLAMVVLLEVLAMRYYRRALDAARSSAPALPDVPRITNPALLRVVAVVGAAVFVGFVTHQATGMPVAVPAVIGAAAAMIAQDFFYVRRHRPTATERRHGILGIIEHDIEWPILGFFAFLFIIVGAAVDTGLIGRVATWLADAVHAGSESMGLADAGRLLLAALLICWVAGVLSAFIDNIPFVAVAIPIVAQLAGEMTGDTMVLWWALSLGACLGGNATSVGASANVTVTGLAERAEARISFREFAKVGAPFAALTLVVSSAYLAVFVFGGARVAYWSFLAVAVVAGAWRRARSTARSRARSRART